ncbi:MAG TPA: AraC family transcriptional regulator [Kofleriaceae bacterium]
MTPRSSAPPCVAGHGTVIDELRVDGFRLAMVEHAPGLAIGRHAHDVPKLAILVAGGATERIGLDLVEHGAGEVVARAPFCAHENQYHAEGARSLIIELDRLPGRHRELPPLVARLHGGRLVAAFGGGGQGSGQGGGGGRGGRGNGGERVRRVRAAVGEALAALRETPPPRVPAWLERARELLYAQIAYPPRLAELARTVGVHPVHLAQAFRRCWNTTPLGYVRAHRVFRAIELIERGGALAQVAAEVGFADQSHMSRAIQRARHAPPGALRRTMRESIREAP